jgi:hypothetical protein
MSEINLAMKIIHSKINLTKKNIKSGDNPSAMDELMEVKN